MSIATLQEKPQRRQSVMPKTVLPEEGRRKQEKAVLLTVEELDRLTEPGHRKRNSELIRELVERIMSKQQ